MRNVNTSSCAKTFFLLIGVGFFCYGASHTYAADETSERELIETKKILELLLDGSPQVVIGHFDIKSIDISQLNENEPVELPFIIEKKIKWQGSIIERFSFPIPYKFFLLRTKKSKDDFEREWRIIEAKYHIKKAEHAKGLIGESEWQQFIAMRKDYSVSHRSEKSFLLSNWEGESFYPNVKYAIFLYRPIGSDIDWERVISTGTIHLGEGVLSKLILGIP